MFFRFSAALLLIVTVSMAGVVLEKRTLELRRSISRQHYQTDLLLEQHVRLRLDTQRLTAPSQLAQLQTDLTNENARKLQPATRRPAPSSTDTRLDDAPPVALPLLRFQRPFNPEGIDR